MKDKKTSTKNKVIASNDKTSFAVLFVVFYLVIGSALIMSAATFLTHEKIDSITGCLIDTVLQYEHEIIVEEPKEIPPLPTPEKVKGIYLTGYTFASDKRRNELVKLLEETELNTLVIDLKDPNGKLIFRPVSEKLKSMPLSPVVLDNNEFKQILFELKNKNIYTVARISTFQDITVEQAFPELALKNKQGGVWKNWQGVTWLDMTNPLAWEVPIEQAKEAKILGFDEIQFDYVRFPSDGNIEQIQYFYLASEERKHQVLSDFYKFISIGLEGLNLPLSVDLFGLTYQIQENLEYDLNIGQRLVDAAPYFDYISPMVYPSHYPTGHSGFVSPVEHPYAIINQALQDGNAILNGLSDSKAQTRPWLQDFDLGANYDANMIREQIRACDENNTAGWLLWNARNVYTEGALTWE